MSSQATYADVQSVEAPKRVVIVDDSRSMRMWLRHLLEADPRIEVVGEAADAQSARAVIKSTNPDVITLDVEMPGIDGLEFLEHLMRLHPMPVVMVSSYTKRGSQAAVKAMALGAADVVSKPEVTDSLPQQDELACRVIAAANSQWKSEAKKPRQVSTAIVLIGASTGGVHALETVLRALNPDGPPVVVVQHMPGSFLTSFCSMLERTLPQDVALFAANESVGHGQIRIAPSDGKTQTEIRRIGHRWCCEIVPSSSDALYNPSVDALFFSAEPYASDVIAVQLTGLGKDGAEGMKRLRNAGARTIGQDKQTSVVYGMPRAAFEMGAVESQLPVGEIAQEVNRLAMKHANIQRMG